MSPHIYMYLCMRLSFDEAQPIKKAIFMFEVKNEQVAESVAELFSVTNNENHELRSNNKNVLTDKT